MCVLGCVLECVCVRVLGCGSFLCPRLLSEVLHKWFKRVPKVVQAWSRSAPQASTSAWSISGALLDHFVIVVCELLEHVCITVNIVEASLWSENAH
jgi:hypothetical protein